MVEEPDNLVLRMLREIRAVQDQHSEKLSALKKQLHAFAKLVTYSLGQSTETQFRQSEQEKKIDELFDKLERLLSDEQPV